MTDFATPHPRPASLRARATARLRTLGVAGLCLAALAGGAAAAGVPGTASAANQRPAAARTASAGPAAGNPLAGHPMGVYKGLADQAWDPYDKATGTEKQLLGKIALAPKAKWFGAWIPDNQIAKKVREYIANAQAGDPNALVQMAFFRMVPWEGEACRRAPTRAEKASYRRWTDLAAGAIGSAHVALILQPDGPFALCTPGGPKKTGKLVSYAAKRLSAQPNTSVYIDAGAWDWPHPGQGGVKRTMKFLIPAGIKYARGVALNSTHYSATELEVQRAADLSKALARRGMPGKKAVINTSSNGKPFEFGHYRGPDAEDAWVCRSPQDKRTCVMLGLPPTTDVASPTWGLPAATRAQAASYVDAYLWFGRPWLYKQADPFVKKRALGLARAWQWG